MTTDLRTKSIDLRTKLLVPHSDDCYAVAAVRKGDWDTPWAFFKDELAFYADTLARRRKGSGSRRWVVAICNCQHCPARIATLENALIAALPTGIES